MILIPHARARRRLPPAVGLLLALCAVLVVLLTTRNRGTSPTAKTPATHAAGASRVEIKLTPAMQALASQPAGPTTGLFLDRPHASDLRVVTYNVNFDKIFPDVDVVRAEKFQRVLKALDPDVLNLQEIREKSAADVTALLNAIEPRPGGETWYAYQGWTNVIVSKYPLSLTADHTVPRGQRELALALVDLPDERFHFDLYAINNHFKCCGGTANDPQRQQQADAIANWIRDARSLGGEIDLPPGTAIVLAGDLNPVGGAQPLATLLTGDIAGESTYGPDLRPDWDDTDLTDARPLQNAVGPDDYTWRDDNGPYPPGRLDFIIYTDSVIEAAHQFVLNTTTMTDEELVKARLERFDVTLDLVGKNFDHLPVVVDFRQAVGK